MNTATDLEPFAEVGLIPDAARPAKSKRRIVTAILAVLALGIVAVPAGKWVRYRLVHETTDNAYVAGHVHPVSARVAGTVAHVLVKDNQPVRAGDALVQLDPADLKVALEQAEAELVQAQALAHRASMDDKRAVALRTGKVIAPQEYDKAKADDEISAGLVRMAQAKVDAAKLQLSYAQIVAPEAGRIGRKSVEAGQRVQPGEPLLSVVQDESWVVANFKETQVSRLHAGQRVEISIDSIPGRTFLGKVDSFSPASGAEFALLPPDNATGNFTRIVQRLPVKIVFDPESIRGFESRIAPGLSAVVSAEVRR